MPLFIFSTLYMFRAHRAHHQERQIVSIQESLHDARSTIYKTGVYAASRISCYIAKLQIF